MNARGRQAIGWLLAATVLVAAVAWTLSELAAGRVSDDSRTFLVAPRVALAGDSPYVRANLHAAFEAWTGRLRAVYPFMYPPPFLLMTAWVVAIPGFAAARLAWFAANLGITLALAWRLSRWARLPLPVTLVGVVAITATRENWTMGNVNIALALVAVEAVMRMSGGWLAVAAWAKLAPAVALASFALRRERSAVAAFLAVSAALCAATFLVFPSGLYSSFVHDALVPMLTGLYTSPMPRLDDPDNASLSHALAWVAPGPTLQQLSPLGRRLHGLALVAMVAATGAASVRESPRAPAMLRIAGAYGAVMILAAPVAWNTHLVLALPALAHAWRVLEPARGARGAAWFALLYVPFLVPSPWIRQAFYVFPPAGAVKMLAVLGLYALCMRTRHPGPTGP